MNWPLPALATTVTISDSLVSHHSPYDHPSDFEHDLPELISRPNDSDKDSWDDSPPNGQRNVWFNSGRTVPTSTNRTWAHSV
jgi:hypothetical protein